MTSDDENCKSQKNTLLHIDAEGPNDSLHYLWNFIDNPSVLVALTNKSSKLNIKWTGDPLSKLKQTTDCLPQKISFNDSAIFSYGLSIKKVCLKLRENFFFKLTYYFVFYFNYLLYFFFDFVNVLHNYLFPLNRKFFEIKKY